MGRSCGNAAKQRSKGRDFVTAVYLFGSFVIGFCLGCAALCAMILFGYKLFGKNVFAQDRTAQEEKTREESAELKRLHRQLDEIEKYRGDAT